MSELANILEGLKGTGELPRRCAVVLEWILSGLGADGGAVLAASPAPRGALEARQATGTLAPLAPLLAAELSRTGIPAAPVVLTLGKSGDESLFCCPVNLEQGVPWSALVFQGPHVQETAATHREDLDEAVGAIRSVLDEERGAGVQGLPEDSRGLGVLLPSLTVLTEGLQLPLYASGPQGDFTYASPGFLALTGYASLEALQARRDFFQEPDRRAEELAALARQGKVESFPLIVKSGGGTRLQVRDSAVLLAGRVFGMFFDVTGLVAANAELKDALQVQELLNDSILAGASQLQRTQGAAIRALARLAEYRDPETGHHLQRICEFTRLIAMEVHRRAPYAFRITREYADDISLSSMLHDVGKVTIPDHILLKPGKLDPGEWEVMKKHTLFGWEVLHKADRELGEQSFLTLAASIALSHHERFDGQGYPHSTGGEQIPLSARITAIADVYDALTSERPYKPPWSHERAVAEIVGQSGGHFDPLLVGIFSDLAGEFLSVRRRFPG